MEERSALDNLKKILHDTFYSLGQCACPESANHSKTNFQNQNHTMKNVLLTWNEYNQLTTDTDDDCWLEKWSTPLIWVNKMANALGKDPKIENEEGEAVKTVRFREPKEVGIANYKFKDALLTCIMELLSLGLAPFVTLFAISHSAFSFAK